MENSSGFYYLSPRKKVKMIIGNQYSNLRLNRGKYVQVHNRFGEDFVFPIKWSSPRHKTTMGVVRISSMSEEEESMTQLERHSKGSVDLVGPIARMVKASPPPMVGPSPIFVASSLIALDKDTPPPIHHFSPYVPIVEEAPFQGDEGLFPWCKELSV
ncbi:hypothetical protein J1N35_019449 [Gossypium stocksii]|uniref:Uncharacterized protein n=1 Tax=Gossypium stocksii TaxID=47602 RepID=A0A9D3VS04_9ROSI|nr:hypothetical protein J1N35_019449 [Gossypium stocksii]